VRKNRFRKAMARLALLAVLLLASLPTTGRLLAFARADAGLVGLCTSSGLKWVQVGGHAGTPAAGHDEDCAYCPLLSTLDAPVVATLRLLSSVPGTTFAFELPSPRTNRAPLSGLGARGPPRIPDAVA